MSLKSLPIRQEGLVADPGPGEGPGGAAPPFLDQTENFFWTLPAPPLLSQGLNPALRFLEK